MPQVLCDDPLFANLKYMVNAFGLRATSDPMHWQLTLADENITPGGALQGGIGMGIAVDALESVTGRQAIWSTAQYLSYAEPPGEIDIKLSLEVVGHRITQARATLHLGKTEVLTTLVALGSRDFEVEGTPVQKPIAQPVEQCRSQDMVRDDMASMFDKMSMVVSKGRTRDEITEIRGDGNSIFYVRIADGPRLINASDIAAVGDTMPMAYGDAFGATVNGNSIDNTVRYGGRCVTEWVMMDCHVFDLQRGFAHGLAHMWGDDGTYLGTASQSTIMRHIAPEGGLLRTAPRRPAN
jgi:hypothetical protein